MAQFVIDRINAELENLAKATANVQESLQLAAQRVKEQRFFIASASFDMHAFYTGLEKIFEIIAKNIDQQLPGGAQWHSALLEQMMQEMPGIRPPVITLKTYTALRDYLGFRHVIRNIYVFNLRHESVIQLGHKLPSTFELVQQDLLTFVNYLNNLVDDESG